MSSNQSLARGIAVDGQHVYWSRTSDGAIGRANLNLSNPTMLVTGQGQAVDITVDDSAIYWLTGSTGKVMGLAK
ncbi:Hypothetical protein CAP_3873 [Chondromyces apiculatus DSM 436]|uniref:Uncharacterized protein n=1 Tax=Chondromyces apiculatus DSM 436 TaxID=1192034 RepID=A0A017T747_9BACT|nr:Hypothetical protein CAP_3873 [Chondromyces apiculatus DSM 436]